MCFTRSNQLCFVLLTYTISLAISFDTDRQSFLYRYEFVACAKIKLNNLYITSQLYK